jgi:hypothetical protein
MNLANPEDSFLLGSTDISSKVQGCTACTNPNIQRGGRRKNQKSQRKSRKNRKLKGGFHVEFDPTQEFPMGPRGGLKGWIAGTNAGINSDLNMNTHVQYQSGGNYSSNEHGIARFGFEELPDMHDFRGSYAPITSNPQGSCMLGGKKNKSRSTTKSSYKKNKRNSKSRNMKKTRKIQRKYKHSGGKKSKSSKNRKSKRHNVKHIKKSRKHRRQKGGYHQYMSNIPHSAQYGLSDAVTPNTSMLANPIPIQKLDTCVDNYNHFTGKGFETGVFDQAPPMM